MSLDSLHWCYVWSIILTSCEPPCCLPESKKSPLNTYQPELHSHSFHCREISVDRFLCCLQRVVNWLRNNSSCFCETLKANRESPAHVWHGKITSLIKIFQSSFLKLSHPRTGDPVSKKERWWSSAAESAVLSRDMRAGSWHIRAAWLGLTYGECGLCTDAPAVASSLICDVHSLTSVTPLSSCSEEILVTLWNPPQTELSWALKFYSSLFLSPSSS